MREARGGWTSIAAVARTSDVPHRPQAARPGMFSKRQLAHCMARPPRYDSAAEAAHPLLDLRLCLDPRLLILLGQPARLLATDDPRDRLGDVQAAGPLDSDRPHDHLAVGADFD